MAGAEQSGVVLRQRRLSFHNKKGDSKKHPSHNDEEDCVKFC
jgi:hypothetical protein